MKPLVSVKNVSKNFRIYREKQNSIKESFINIFRKGEVHEFKVLDNITFDVNPGDFLGIIGRNGCGKSTLLKTIVGIYEQDSGTIEINGTLVPFLELGVGFNPDLSARENIYLNGVILGMSRKFIQERFTEIVDFAEVHEFIDTPVKNFSSGMMVRLAFAIAIQIEADIYILDEVLAVGDIAFQQKCIARLNELVEKKKTIIYVSHAMDTVTQYCNKVVWLDAGKVVEIGDPASLVGKYIEQAVGH